MLQVAVVIASKGRPAVLAETLESVGKQSLLPRQVVLSVVSQDDDLPSLLPSYCETTVVTGPPGLTLQRNRAVGKLVDDVDVVLFLDDDVELHAEFLRRLEQAYSNNPDVALVGANVIADGNIDRAQARKLLQETEQRGPTIRHGTWAYGCGMSATKKTAQQVRFDERLPLYALYEDYDWSSRCRAAGRVCVGEQCFLVHLKVPSARVSKRRFGFSQIMNSFYLWKKGSIDSFREMLLGHWIPGVTASIGRAFLWNSKGTEARQQLLGQATAFLFLVRGRIEPEHILNMR